MGAALHSPLIDFVIECESVAEFACGLSLRGLAAASGVNRQSIADLLAGRSWPDVATIALLETALAVRLWPEDTPASR